jgi:hypothetical protein
MMTLEDTRPVGHPEALPEFCLANIRHEAITAIALGLTPEPVRDLGAATQHKRRLQAIAREVEALTARGFTQRHALRCGRDEDSDPRIRWSPDAAPARDAARIFLEAGKDPAWARNVAREAPRQDKAMWHAIATAMAGEGTQSRGQR